MSGAMSRIGSQAYKSFKTLRRNSFRLADVLIWPLIFLFTLTFFATFLGTDQTYLYMIITGMMGWRVVYFLNLDMVASLTEEHWSKSLPYLMASPISRIEMALGAAVSGIVKAAFVVLFYLVSTNLLYGFIVPDWGLFILGLSFLAVFGFTMGLITLGLAYFMKEDAFNIAFIFPDVIVLLSGVYFTIESVYPAWALPIIRLLPTVHAFNALKQVVGVGTADIPLLVALSAIWLVAAYLLNGFLYERARRSGKLARLG